MKFSAFRGLLLPIILLICWQLLSKAGFWSTYLLPPPETVFEAGKSLFESGILWKHILVSIARVIGGFILACLFAFPLAILLGLHPRLSPWFTPTLNFFRHTPPLALIPILILWLGIGEGTKLSIIILASFFPIFLNAESGIRNANFRLIEVGKSLGYSKKMIFQKIILPASLPSIALGMRLGMGYSWRALIGAEMIAASSGLGYLILDAEQMSRSDIIIVGILSIGILGSLMDWFFRKLYQDWLPWGQEVLSYERD